MRTVVQRLQYLLSKPELVKQGDANKRGLAIITGIGRNSYAGNDTESMKTIIKKQLQQLQLQFVVGQNDGRILIPFDALYQYVQQEQRYSALSTFMHGATLRYLMVGSGVSGLVAAMYVVPKLMSI